MRWLTAHELPEYQNETPMESFRRRMRWRREDVRLAHIQIARARAFNRGHRFCGVVPVYASDATEKEIQAAIRRLNFASWGTHS